MIDVELSNIWGSVSLPDLLSGEKDLFDAHMQLRTNQPDGPDFLGWLNAPEGVMARAVLSIGKAAEQIADKLQDFGVLVLAKPFTGAQFRQAVQIAASSYKRLAVLRTENAKLLDKIAQLRLVDRAKCYLIEKKGYTETDAHRLIEKRAMDTRMSRGEVAQEILEEEEEE